MKIRWFAPLVLVLLAGSLACGPRETATEEPAGSAVSTSVTETTGAGEAGSVTTTDAVIDPDVAKLAIEDPIQVSITDSAIRVTGTPVAGATRFQISNDGSQDQMLVIEGAGVREQLPAPLKPLETNSIVVTLAPGSYRLYSPANPQLSAELTVPQPTP